MGELGKIGALKKKRKHKKLDKLKTQMGNSKIKAFKKKKYKKAR